MIVWLIRMLRGCNFQILIFSFEVRQAGRQAGMEGSRGMSPKVLDRRGQAHRPSPVVVHVPLTRFYTLRITNFCSPFGNFHVKFIQFCNFNSAGQKKKIGARQKREKVRDAVHTEGGQSIYCCLCFRGNL